MLPIQTPRLVIRPFTLDDVEQIHQAYSAPACGWPLPPGGPSETLEDTQGVVRRILDTYEAWDGLGPWAVQTRVDAMVIGDCGLFRCADAWALGEIEIAYRIGPASWGAGLATEAAWAVLAYGFDELQVPRIVADADARNGASLRVLEKIGMRIVGWTSDGDRTTLYHAAEHPRNG